MQNDKLSWWREARLGMFIHWGLYSLMAQGEWVMYFKRIPVKEYEKLAHDFNPVPVDPEQWVLMAKDAGMKYIVITAKHHDGFSMFRTDVDPFNIVDGTPYGKDIMLDLAKACQKHDIRLCFYYSHVREWRHPQAQSLEMSSPDRYGNYGNFWDYPDECRKNLQTYIDTFDKPQIRELLTQYGPIGILWFDTPSLIRPDQAQSLTDLVRECQPDCLVNSRVGDFVDFDYHSLGDDEVPEFNNGVDFETPMTICDAWGYNNSPGNRYKDNKTLIRQMIDIVSLGGNYLLNVGPDSMGEIPAEARERFRLIGEWMRRNSEAIHGTTASPFHAKPSWGRVTATSHALYLHVYEWAESISLTGLQSVVRQLTLLDDPDQPVAWKQTACGDLGYDRLEISLPAGRPDPNASVVKLSFDEPVNVVPQIIQDDAGAVQLPACCATLHTRGSQPQAEINITGVVQRWLSTDDWFSWAFICAHPGVFAVEVSIRTGFHGIWDFGHTAQVAVDGQKSTVLMADTGIPTSGYQKRTFQAGTVTILFAGLHELRISALEISSTSRQGIQLSSIRLVPVW